MSVFQCRWLHVSFAYHNYNTYLNSNFEIILNNNNKPTVLLCNKICFVRWKKIP